MPRKEVYVHKACELRRKANACGRLSPPIMAPSVCDVQS